MSASDTDTDPQYQTTPIAFDESELTVCPACGRRNAPSRTACLYCGDPIEAQDGFTASLNGSREELAADDLGFNIVVPLETLISSGRLVLPKSDHTPSAAGTFVPFGRYGSANDAQAILERDSSLAAGGRIVADSMLDARVFPVRLAAAAFDGDSLSLTEFNTGRLVSFRFDEVAVVVEGAIARTKADVLEKRGRHGKSKLLNETVTDSDEAILDLYVNEDTRGFRVNLTGFDFSCLGAEKTSLAAQNIRILSSKLRDACPAARFVRDYASLRDHLDPIWPLEVINDHRGIVRAGLGKAGFGRTATTDNVLQMNKFSRLQALAK